MTNRETPLDVYPELSGEFAKVNYQMHRHIEVYEKLVVAIGAYAEDILYGDIVALAAITRSARLLHGFLTLIDQWNYQGALVLVRSHLDNLMVIGYMLSAPDREQYCEAITRATKIGELKDQLDPKQGKLSWRKLRGYAIARNADLAPWLNSIYEMASDFTHFSRSSLSAGLKWADLDGERLSFSFGTPAYRAGAWNPSPEEIEGWLGSAGYTTMVMLDWLEEYVHVRGQKSSERSGN